MSSATSPGVRQACAPSQATWTLSTLEPPCAPPAQWKEGRTPHGVVRRGCHGGHVQLRALPPLTNPCQVRVLITRRFTHSASAAARGRSPDRRPSHDPARPGAEISVETWAGTSGRTSDLTTLRGLTPGARPAFLSYGSSPLPHTAAEDSVRRGCWWPSCQPSLCSSVAGSLSPSKPQFLHLQNERNRPVACEG